MGMNWIKTHWIAIGGGLYWGASILFLTVWRPTFGVEAQGDPMRRTLLWLFISIVIGALLTTHKWLMEPRGQKVLAGAALITTLAYILLAVVVPANAGSTVAAIVVQGLHHALLIVFWGLAYVSLGKLEAERTVVVSLLVALALYFVGLLMPAGSWSAPLAAVLRAVGILPFMLGIGTLSTCERAIASNGLTALVPFYLGRICLGASMAPLFFLASLPLGATGPDVWLSIVCALLVVGFLVATVRGRGLEPGILRVAPLVILGALSLPFLVPALSLGGVVTLLSGSVVWLSWISLSAAQLSDIKERVGLDDAFLATSEKAAVITALFLGYALCSLAFGQIDRNVLAEYRTILTVIPLYLGIIVCSFQFAALIDRKRQQQLLRKGLLRAEDQLRIVHDTLAKRYGLTERERDVFVLMAAGHTRPRIREQLCVSDGTVKTHSYHIYEKMGIHSREELYALVEAERTKMIDLENADLEQLM